MTTRRRFLGRLAIVGAAVALAPRAWISAAFAAPTRDPSLADVSARVGQRFTATSATGQASAVVLAAVETPRSLVGYPDARRARALCFTLVFESADALAEGIHRFTAPGLDFEAFAAPMRTPGGGAVRHEVVFNRV
jgi:hypothetical protein